MLQRELCPLETIEGIKKFTPKSYDYLVLNIWKCDEGLHFFVAPKEEK